MSSPLKGKVWGIMTANVSWLGMLPHPRETDFFSFSFSRLLNEKEAFKIERFAALGKKVAIQ
jgi:hypothetical protein